MKKYDIFLTVEKYIEDIYFFEVNTKYISSSAVKKNQYFSRVRSTSENADISPHEMKYILYLP